MANRETPPELLWSLVLEAGWVQAGIWYIGTEAADVISVGPPTAWETEDELIGATDAALSSAVQKLPENYAEPSKTVFGVPSAWVKDGEIGEEYLAKIKTLCTELSLSPVGFVVLPEAIAHLIKSEEAAPLSGIILGLGKETLEVSVFKLGNLVGTTQVARSISIIEDVTEGLSRFEGAAPLPSRFIIYDGKGGELEEAKDALMKENWQREEKLKFLHTPKAETLTSDRKVLATSLAGANEIGNVSKVVTEEKNDASDVSATEEVQNISEPEKEVTAEELGFAVGQDISAKSPMPSPALPPITQRPGIVPPVKMTGYLEKTKRLLHGFSSKIFSKAASPSSINKKPLITLAAVAVILLVGLGLAWWFLPKADVSIYVSPRKFEETADIKFDAGGKFDAVNGIVPAQTLTAQVNGDKTKATSGTKTIGDKAKGNVEIANGNASAIDLAAGTILVSSSGLKFVTNAEASVSGQLIPGSPGTMKVDVTAYDIGSQYNLVKGEVFKVGNYSKSLVAATSQGDFSGGNSQQISAVSKDDQTSLETQLREELSGSAKDQLSQKAGDDQIFVDDLAAADISSENFDRKIGDEATSLKLSLTLDTTGLAADKAKLYEYARGVLKDKIPSGFVLRDSQIDFKFTFVSKQDGQYSYKATIAANFLPEVNTDDILRQITGKTGNIAQSYLSSIPGFTRANVTLKPRLPGFLGTLPRVKSNISVTILPE